MQEQHYGKYVLQDRIAIGGMAEIFLARQTGLEGFERTVVLKRIRPHLGDKQSFVRMFLNEAKLAAQLNHPNIIQIHDLGKVGESYFIAMEYLSGRDMRRVIPKAESLGIPFPIVYACKIASQVCEGLYHAHERTDVHGAPLGIVHRDVTPENIFVSFDGGVKVLDFGIAKAANQVELTRAGEIKGKLSYMSPEQCTGKPLDHRSDIFSLGVVLYEWITGFRLFTGESDVQILKSITDGKIYQPSYFKHEVPEQVEAILMRALQKDPALRYQSAWEMQYELDRFLVANEFTPSNNHLATFMKQLFADELQTERGRLPGRSAQPPTGGALPAGVADDGPAFEPHLGPPTRDEPIDSTDPQRHRAGKADEANVQLQLAPDELRELSALAARRQVSIDELVRQMVQCVLRFR